MKHQICIVFFLHLLSAPIFSQSWESTPGPPDFLTDHSFGFAINGKGYLVAGTTEFDGHSNAFMQYDPVADTWALLDTFPGDARGYGIGDTWEGKAYFGFGTSATEMLNDLWVFDADSMRWTELKPCPCEPRLHPAMIAGNGKIFVGLGNNSNGNQNDWWEYDIATDEWAQKPDFPDTRRHHPFQFTVDGYVYAGFGHGSGIFKDLYRYDPQSEEWSRMADLPGEGRVAGTQFSYDNKGYVLSGDGEDHLSMEEGEFWSYEPLNDTWHQLPSHPGKSRWAPASFIINGIVYLFNGTTYFEGSGYVYQTEAYKFDLEGLISSSEAVNAEEEFSIVPNPANTEIKITWRSIATSSNWRLSDVNGRTVRTGQFQNYSGQETIETGELSPGIYFISSENLTRKIFIQH